MTVLKEYPSCFTGRTLGLVAYENDRRIKFVTATPDEPNVGIDLSGDNAVDLAVRILERLDPDRLAPTPFIDLPNGTFLRRKADGKIARVIPTPEAFEHRELEDDNNWLEFDDGKPFIAIQQVGDPAWEVLAPEQVESVVTTTWRFKA